MRIQTSLGFLLILLAVSGCSSSSQQIRPASEPQAEGEEVEAGILVTEAETEPSGGQEETLNYWQDALDTGMSAAVLAQTAKFPNDWELVASRWQRAIASLQAIPEADTQYQTAQAKIAEYQRNLQVAQQHAQSGTVSRAAAATPATSSSLSPSTSSSNPSSSSSSGNTSSSSPPSRTPISAEASQLCEGSAAKSSDQPYGLSRLQWHQSPLIDPFSFDAFEPNQLEGSVFLIGCVTNNSSQPITAPYLWGAFPDALGGMLFTASTPTDMIQPGQVVPFSALVNQPLASVNPSSEGGNSSGIKISGSFPTDEIAAAQHKIAEAKRYCNGVAPRQLSKPFEVNKLQIRVPTYDPFDFGKRPDEGYVIGCITNHSNQPITNIMMSYTFNGYGFSMGSLHLPVRAIQPGETMVFREMGSFLTTDRSNITVEGFTSNVGDIEVNTPVAR